MDGAHATADFEDGAPVEAALGKGLDQLARQANGALVAIRAQFLGCDVAVELAIKRGVAG